jgi:hypothetical protein
VTGTSDIAWWRRRPAGPAQDAGPTLEFPVNDRPPRLAPRSAVAAADADDIALLRAALMDLVRPDSRGSGGIRRRFGGLSFPAPGTSRRHARRWG